MNEFGTNPLYSVSFPGHTWQCGLNYTNTKIQTLENKNMILLLEDNIRGDINSVMGDWYVCSTNSLQSERAIADENRKYCTMMQVIYMVRQ